MTPEKNTTKLGWKAHSVMAIAVLALAVNFFTAGTHFAGIVFTAFAIYYAGKAVRLREASKCEVTR